MNSISGYRPSGRAPLQPWNLYFNDYNIGQAPLQPSNVYFNNYSIGGCRPPGRAPLQPSNLYVDNNLRTFSKERHKKRKNHKFVRNIFACFGPSTNVNLKTDIPVWAVQPNTDFTLNTFKFERFDQNYVKKCEINQSFLNECLAVIDIETNHLFNNLHRATTTYHTTMIYQDVKEFNFTSLCKKIANNFVINQIEEVHNRFLLLGYELKKRQYQMECPKVREMILFHGTFYSFLHDICNNNYNWRLFGLSRGYKFGQGVSFSPSFHYSSHYGNVMTIAKVLVSKHSVGNSSTVVPPDKHDTTTNDRCGVFVKYDDNTFLPSYVLHYTPKYLPLL